MKLSIVHLKNLNDTGQKKVVSALVEEMKLRCVGFKQSGHLELGVEVMMSTPHIPQTLETKSAVID